LGSSLSDLLGRLPGRALPARLSDGAGPARGAQGCRTPGAPAREHGAAPPDRPGPLPASQPAVAFGTVPADPPAPVGRGVHGDPGDAAGLAPATGHPQMGLLRPAASRPAVHGSRDPQARGPHGDRQPGLGGTGACRASSSSPATRSLLPRCGRSCMPRGPILRPAARARPPGSPGALLHRDPSGPRMPLIAARGPSKPLGRFRSSAAARCFPPAGTDVSSGGRWRVRGVSGNGSVLGGLYRYVVEEGTPRSSQLPGTTIGWAEQHNRATLESMEKTRWAANTAASCRQAPVGGFACFSRPSDLASPLKMISCGRTGRSASTSALAMKAGGSTRAAAGTVSSYSVLTLTVTTPAGIAK